MSRPALIISSLILLLVLGIATYLGSYYFQFRGSLYTFLGLVQYDKADQAYKLLIESYQKRLSEDKFRDMMKYSGMAKPRPVSIRYHVLHFLGLKQKEVFLETTDSNGIKLSIKINFVHRKLLNGGSDYRVSSISLFKTKELSKKSVNSDSSSVTGIWDLKEAKPSASNIRSAWKRPAFLQLKSDSKYSLKVYTDAKCTKVSTVFSGGGKWAYAARKIKFTENSGGYYFNRSNNWYLLSASKDKIVIWIEKEDVLRYARKVSSMDCQ